jgi:hypothetical protein
MANAVVTMSVAIPSSCSADARERPPAVQRTRRRRDQAADEPAQHDAHQDDHDRRDHARDVADQLREHVRQRLEPQRVRRHEDHGEHHEPEHQIGEDADRVEVRARSLDRLHHPTALQHAVQADAAQEALGQLLEHLRQEVSGEQDDERAEECGHELTEDLGEARLQPLPEVGAGILEEHGLGWWARPGGASGTS